MISLGGFAFLDVAGVRSKFGVVDVSGFDVDASCPFMPGYLREMSLTAPVSGGKRLAPGL